MEKRAQGRPCRGTSEVGRVKIVEGVRSVIRSGAHADLSRKYLAAKIGITPALITYYFPKKENLLLEVVRPIIEQYVSTAETIATADDAPDVKIRNVIKLLVEVYNRDAYTIQVYRTIVAQSGNECDLMADLTAALSKVFCEFGGGPAASFHAAVLQGAVHGMCEFSARANQAAPTSSAMSPVEPCNRWLAPVKSLFASSNELFASMQQMLLDTSGLAPAQG